MRWLRPAEWGAGAVVGLLVLLSVAAIVGLFIRRRLLSREGGVFDCAANMRGRGWSTGFARYRRNEFQWFRTFSIAIGPTMVLPRSGARIIESRGATPAELEDLADLTSVLRIAQSAGAAPIELAMGSGSATGLMSWLESAPPGRREL